MTERRGDRETGDGETRAPHIASSPHPPSPIPPSPRHRVNIPLFCLFLAIPYRAVYFEPCEFPYVLMDFFAQMHVASVLLPHGRRNSFSLQARTREE